MDRVVREQMWLAVMSDRRFPVLSHTGPRAQLWQAYLERLPEVLHSHLDRLVTVTVLCEAKAVCIDDMLATGFVRSLLATYEWSAAAMADEEQRYVDQATFLREQAKKEDGQPPINEKWLGWEMECVWGLGVDMSRLQREGHLRLRQVVYERPDVIAVHGVSQHI